ncbi:hypothetical protein ADUPG1_008310 [Aduncisulcus paluster]|uniref:Uncharacterized protein n=1 Tax=Aduncisulcus paluster TaxID=2918883 RepID=A0ABQ5KRH1_9EUKA|nr:hypothetical protein ADUPG1_008310 [Aduncisulcus paluster]
MDSWKPEVEKQEAVHRLLTGCCNASSTADHREVYKQEKFLRSKLDDFPAYAALFFASPQYPLNLRRHAGVLLKNSPQSSIISLSSAASEFVTNSVIITLKTPERALYTLATTALARQIAELPNQEGCDILSAKFPMFELIVKKLVEDKQIDAFADLILKVGEDAYSIIASYSKLSDILKMIVYYITGSHCSGPAPKFSPYDPPSDLFQCPDSLKESTIVNLMKSLLPFIIQDSSCITSLFDYYLPITAMRVMHNRESSVLLSICVDTINAILYTSPHSMSATIKPLCEFSIRCISLMGEFQRLDGEIELMKKGGDKDALAELEKKQDSMELGALTSPIVSKFLSMWHNIALTRELMMVVQHFQDDLVPAMILACHKYMSQSSLDKDTSSDATKPFIQFVELWSQVQEARETAIKNRDEDSLVQCNRKLNLIAKLISECQNSADDFMATSSGEATVRRAVCVTAEALTAEFPNSDLCELFLAEIGKYLKSSSMLSQETAIIMIGVVAKNSIDILAKNADQLWDILLPACANPHLPEQMRVSCLWCVGILSESILASAKLDSALKKLFSVCLPLLSSKRQIVRRAVTTCLCVTLETVPHEHSDMYILPIYCSVCECIREYDTCAMEGICDLVVVMCKHNGEAVKKVEELWLADKAFEGLKHTGILPTPSVSCASLPSLSSLFFAIFQKIPLSLIPVLQMLFHYITEATQKILTTVKSSVKNIKLLLMRLLELVSHEWKVFTGEIEKGDGQGILGEDQDMVSTEQQEVGFLKLYLGQMEQILASCASDKTTTLEGSSETMHDEILKLFSFPQISELLSSICSSPYNMLSCDMLRLVGELVIAFPESVAVQSMVVDLIRPMEYFMKGGEMVDPEDMGIAWWFCQALCRSFKRSPFRAHQIEMYVDHGCAIISTEELSRSAPNVYQTVCCAVGGIGCLVAGNRELLQTVVKAGLDMSCLERLVKTLRKMDDHDPEVMYARRGIGCLVAGNRELLQTVVKAGLDMSCLERLVKTLRKMDDHDPEVMYARRGAEEVWKYLQ